MTTKTESKTKMKTCPHYSGSL